MTNIDQMTLIFRALAHPARLLILETLRSGQDSIKELSKPFEMSKPAITRHLKILEQAGLISRSRKAKSQPAKLELQSLKQIDEWMKSYRQFWNESLDQLDGYISELKRKGEENFSDTNKRASDNQDP